MSLEQVRATIAEAKDVAPNPQRPDTELIPRIWPQMAEEAFIGLPGDIISMIEPHTESDPNALLLNLHTMFGNAIGRGPHYRVEGTNHAPNLFVLQVGDTAKARKGTGADRVRQLFRSVDEEWVSRRVHTGLSSGEGVIWEVRDPIFKRVKGVEEETDAGVKDKRLMILESEFAGALRVMQREGNILSRVLRDAWDRGDLATLTKNSPARAAGACVSIIGHITATELRACLDKTEMANGFANRFLFACVRRSKLLPFGGNLDDATVTDMAGSVKTAVETAKNVDQVSFTKEAALGWEAAYETLSSDRQGLLGALTARAEAQVVRLALIYALWEGTNRITLPHLKAAMAVWEYCEASVEYLFGDMLGDAVADTLLSALRGSSNGLTRTQLSAILGRNVASNQIARALKELERRGLARVDVSATGPGRPPETWHAVKREG